MGIQKMRLTMTTAPTMLSFKNLSTELMLKSSMKSQIRSTTSYSEKCQIWTSSNLKCFDIFYLHRALALTHVAKALITGCSIRQSIGQTSLIFDWKASAVQVSATTPKEKDLRWLFWRCYCVVEVQGWNFAVAWSKTKAQEFSNFFEGHFNLLPTGIN